jgi:hypothetical protein
MHYKHLHPQLLICATRIQPDMACSCAEPRRSATYMLPSIMANEPTALMLYNLQVAERITEKAVPRPSATWLLSSIVFDTRLCCITAGG